MKTPWGFREQEGHLQDDQSRCSVFRNLLCPIGGSWKVISGGNTYYGQGPSCKFFKGEVKVSHEPAGSPLPSAQNNLQAKGHILGRLF